MICERQNSESRSVLHCTGKAAILEGFRFVGIGRDEDYVRIAGQRINHAKKGKA